MNRLTKSSSRRGSGGHGTRSPSVRVPVASASPRDASAAGCSASTADVIALASHLLQSVLLPLVDAGQRHLQALGYTHQEGSQIFLQSNLFASHPKGNENFYFVGARMSQSPVSPVDLDATRTPSPAQQTDDIVEDLDADEDETINVDEDSRTDRHLNWSVPEDRRLASAWLRNSKDPIDGNGKTADAYGSDVAKEHNKTTETSCKRKVKLI